MHTRIFALAGVLSAVACGGSDPRPAQDPSSADTIAAPSNTATTASSPGDASRASPAQSAPGAAQGMPGTEMAGTPAHGDPGANGPVVAPTNSGAQATAVDNPGGADRTKNVDNTKINERDRHGTLTPMDQGSSGSETTITATIRKGIMRDKTLSFTAKNVKIITVGTKVTLRGPVKSDQEKAAIEAVAKQTTGVSDVDNQLEVKN